MKDINSIVLTRHELNIMNALWDLGGATVQSVHESVHPGNTRSYFSIMTMMRTLEKKGIVRHTKRGRAYFYSPVLTRRQAVSNQIRNLLDSYFNGNPDDLVQWLREYHSSLEASSKTVSGGNSPGPRRP